MITIQVIQEDNLVKHISFSGFDKGTSLVTITCRFSESKKEKNRKIGFAK